MSRKDYIAFAAQLANVRPYVSRRSTKLQRAEYAVWLECRGAVMSVLAADNYRFDRQRFIAATEENSNV